MGTCREEAAGLDHAMKDPQPDPFADYVEWTQHRYDPGHYLGGTLPPHLRPASLGRRGRRLAGVFLGLMALGTAASAATSIGSWWERLLYVPLGILVAAAAVKMYRAGRDAPPGR